MYTDFHERYLAKIVAMDMLSKFAGYTNNDSLLTVTGAQLENDAGQRRSVIQSLIKDKFLDAGPPGQKFFVVAQKAFNECDLEPYVGELNIGTPDKPLATWISGPMMKQAIEDLVSGKAVIRSATKGRGKVVVSTVDSRSESERAFDVGLAENLGEIACTVTGMSKSFSECLKVPPNSITALGIGEEMLKLHSEQGKEIERLKRTNDAMVVFFHEVDQLGGWDEFIRLAKEGVTI